MCLNWYDSQVSVTSCGDQAPESFVGDDQADQEPAATTTSEPSSKRAKPTVVKPRTLKRPATQLTFMESFRAKANQKFRGLSQASLSVHLKSSCDGATSGTAAWFDPLGTRFEP